MRKRRALPDRPSSTSPPLEAQATRIDPGISPWAWGSSAAVGEDRRSGLQGLLRSCSRAHFALERLDPIDDQRILCWTSASRPSMA